jgi:Fur family transcriptional regulator, peroxide stress response regulator
VERRLTKESTTGANPLIPAIRKKSKQTICLREGESFDKLYHLTIMRRETYNEFRQLCREHNLAATHQRQKIYEALVSRPGHYSPEEIYEQVKQDLPSISLATVYKNLKTFVHAGMLHEVSPHHGSWRIDANRHPHHHLVCTRCRSITDLPVDSLAPVKLRGTIPSGFRVEKFSIELHGICRACAATEFKSS